MFIYNTHSICNSGLYNILFWLLIRYFKFNLSENSNKIEEFYKVTDEYKKGDKYDFYNQHNENAGIDLYIPNATLIKSHCKVTINLEISIELLNDNKNEAFLLIPRSSFGKTTLQLCNSIGLIDKGYRGTLKAIVYNYGDEDIFLEYGRRLFQIVSHDLKTLPYCIVDKNELSTSVRGVDGFGSSGH